MLFNSLTFCVFFCLVVVIYFQLTHRKQNLFLLLASYVFYGWWDWRFLSLLAISTVVDFYCARRIDGSDRPRERRKYLLASICTNLGILGFFKYFNFFVDSMAGLMEGVGFQPHMPLLSIILPVGISFYTFQTLGYTIDVYRKKRGATCDFPSFALYVSYFPQLVAGPIERSTHLLPQIQKPRQVSNAQIGSGLQLMLMGYFKKVCIADAVAPFVTECFHDPAGKGGMQLLVGLYLFALQIYGDFSGYTDIARGISRILGIELGINFKQPYLSTSISEYWRRWHLSLSSWLRDYIYIPLGGSRKGKAKTYRNLMITMLLAGLWHGAGWTFVVWGGLNGLFLSLHKWMRGQAKVKLSVVPDRAAPFMGWAIRVFLTFNLVCFTKIFFRSHDFKQAFAYLDGLLGKNGYAMDLTSLVMLFFYGSLWFFIDFSCRRKESELPFQPNWAPWIRGLVYAAMIVLMSFVGAPHGQPFIYFQF